MIATVSEVKALLQITTTAKDDVITALLPTIDRFILDWTKNQFKQIKVRMESSFISFSELVTISDSDALFIECKFTPGTQIVVEGSLYNDGVYEISSLTAGSLTLATGSGLIDEAAGECITITMVNYPKSLKLDIAQMVAYAMNKAGKEGIQSESLGDYSVTFMDATSYPLSILNRLKPYRKIGW